jgi:hypothetical protein
VYQIEGTKKASLITAEVSVKGSAKGSDVTQITLGTLLYAKIPEGKTATFRINVEIKAQVHGTYSITITRINYKFDPKDARYKRFEKEIKSGRVILD